MTSAGYFSVVVLLTLPATVAYPIIYVIGARNWWRDWIGRALLTKAVGLAILAGMTAAVIAFGPDYAYREEIRNVGITIVCIGVWMALFAMLREFHRRD